MNYVTLEQVHRQLKLAMSENTDDALLLDWIKWSSDLIDLWKGRVYYPFVDTYYFDSPVDEAPLYGAYNIWELARAKAAIIPTSFSKPLHLHKDLLEVIELKNADAIAITSYYLEPKNKYPKSSISLPRSNQWLLDSNQESRQAIPLKAVWGYVNNYPNCYVNSGDTVQNNPLAIGDTTLTVNNTGGIANDLQSPRFQTGQLLRLKKNDGTFEFVLTLLVVDTTHVTIARAQNGTTALQFAQNTVIEIFRPQGDIVQMCIRLVQWRYRQKDNDTFDKVYDLGSNVVNQPSALPADVKLILGERGKLSISS